MINIIRGIIKKVTADEGELARADVRGRGDDDNHETFLDREIFGQYGFCSHPPKDAECLLVSQGQNVYILASADRRYKLDLKEGEVALYDNSGNAIHLQNSGDIYINANKNVYVNDGSKGAARTGDSVKITIPKGTFIGDVTGQAVAVPSSDDLTFDGIITEGSNTVFIGD